MHRLLILLIAAIAPPASSSNAVTIAVTPQISMLDRRVAIAVHAPPGNRVSLHLQTERFGMVFESDATVVTQPSGTFALDDMGLFWSALATHPAARGAQFSRSSDLDPRPYTISARAGGSEQSSTLVRTALDPTTLRTVVDHGSFVATLFSGKDGVCRPGAIVLGGSEGGVPEEQAAVIASHGFTTLALAYFGAAGLPKFLENIPIETVSRAIVFMRANAAVCRNRRLAIVGGSKGAELALVAASTFRDIGVVVAMKPSSVVFSGLGPATAASSWSYRGKPLPFANGTVPQAVYDRISADRKKHRQVAYTPMYLAQLQNNTDEAAIIPVEKISGPVLLVAGGSDELWPSLQMANAIMRRLKSAKRSYEDRLLSYSDAGHSIGIPFGFAKAELAHGELALGGTPEGNERASEDAWPKIMQFLKANAF
jgi:dienelactone hydrolase